MIHGTISSSFGERLLGLVMGAAMLLAATSAGAAYTAAVNGTTLVVTGDQKSDQLALRLDASGTRLIVDVKNDGTPDFTFDRALFTAVTVSAGAGNDTVMIDESAGAFTDESIVIDGGPGRDTLVGGSGADLILGGDGDDVVDARRGNDVVLLGDGDDVVVWNPGDGSDTLEGQAGEDRLEFRGANISESFDVSANGGRVRFLRNVANIGMDLNGMEEIDLAALGGADVVAVNDLTGTDMKRVHVDLGSTAGGGDGQPDAVLVQGSPGADLVNVGVVAGNLEVGGLAATVQIANGESALDRVTYAVGGPDEVDVVGTKKADTITIGASPVLGAVRTSVDGFPMPVDVSGGGSLTVLGLGGNDTITAANGIAALGTALEIDGGPGNDVITGGDGADVLIGGRGKDIVRGARGNDVLLLGSGSDTAIWDPGDGSDTIEGEAGGNDRLEFHGANINEIFDLSPNGSRVRFSRNVANITMDLDGVEQVTVAALGGADQCVVNDLSGTAIKGVTVELEATPGSGAGDGQVDTVVVNGTPAAEKISITAGANGVVLARKGGAVRIAHPEPTDTLMVNGLGGGDKFKVTSTVSSAIAVTINPN